MKNLKEFIEEPNVDAIKNWLDSMDIKNYTINKDLTIDVSDSVKLSHKGLIEFPDYIQFNHIKGNFDCSYNSLTSLRGCPKIIEGSFWCQMNHLTSLEFGPLEVKGLNYDCSYNRLTTLKGSPKIIKGYFDCSYNKLTKYDGPEEVGGDFYCQGNKFSRKPKNVKVRGTSEATFRER